MTIVEDKFAPLVEHAGLAPALKMGRETNWPGARKEPFETKPLVDVER